MPLDPIQRDWAIRTAYGEDPNLSAEGVLSVIRNRTLAGRYGGNDVKSVVTAKNQFEPWNRADARARMENLNPESEDYKRLGAIADQVWSGDRPDVTNGATHFYAPKAQAAAGRSAPTWATGPGQQIGPHMFYAPEGRVARPQDAEGPPEAPPEAGPMLSQYSSQSRSVAPQQPALSQSYVNGPGALSAPAAKEGFDWQRVSRALQGAGMHLSGNTGGLGAVQQLPKNHGYDFITGQDGQIFRVNKAKGTIEAVGGRGKSKAEEAYDLEDARAFAKIGQELPDQIEKSYNRLNDLDTAKRLVMDPNVRQGAGGEWSLEAKKLGEIFGIKSLGTNEAELLRSLANRTTLELRNPSSGAGMPGALSDSDRDFLKQANFGLNNTREGNLRIIDIARRAEQRKLELANHAQKLMEANGGRYDGNVRKKLNEWRNSQSIFTDEDKAGLASPEQPSGGLPKGVKSISIIP
jgi:hypothetical protein